jgi:hypothetical protein
VRDYRDQPYRHAVEQHVDVEVVLGVMLVQAGQLADRGHQPGTGRERPGAEVRAGAFTQHPPVLYAVGLTGTGVA